MKRRNANSKLKDLYGRMTGNLFSQGGAIGSAVVVVLLLIVNLLLPKAPTSHTWAPVGTPTAATAAVPNAPSEHDHATIPGGLVSITPGETASTLFACPMNCVPPREAPGDCPICGMDLVAAHGAASPSASAQARITLSPEAIQRAELQTSTVSHQAVDAHVRLYGRIDYDSAHTTEITAFMPGVVDRVYVKRAGQFVRWGDPLFDIYSSDLLETQRQLISATRHVPSFLAFQAGSAHTAQDVPVQARSVTGGAGQRTPEQEAALETLKAIRRKLSILGLPKRDIDEMMKKGEATGIATVYAPMYGQVIVQDATEGAFVNTGAPLFTIADPKYVWARLDVYESDYPWIRRGQEVVIGVEAYPGETFAAKVVYIDPVFDPTTRTFSIGAITTEDQGGRLKAGMLVRATLKARLDAQGRVLGPGRQQQALPLTIPATAPLITGKRSLVYVADPERPGSFEGREVVLGPRTGDYYVVREGLTAGERVVTRGNFKLDSALQIQARPSLMYPQGGVGTPSHHHHDEEKQAAAIPTSGMTAPGAAHSGHAGHIVETPPPATSVAGPVAAPVAAPEGHHHPGDSAEMAATYNARRQLSRQQSDAEHPTHDMERMVERPGDRQSGRVIRRKPGQYGDRTRRALESLGHGRKVSP